ncbi:hypothetical protein DFH29DRAFT_1001843 [Suillus ampliporus]|nr:hypothetical protein DFH29DRAFT_1001843 [Suillus ampliporus]
MSKPSPNSSPPSGANHRCCRRLEAQLPIFTPFLVSLTNLKTNLTEKGKQTTSLVVPLLNTIYTGPDAAYTVSVGLDTTDTIDAGHTPTLESIHTLIPSSRSPHHKELPLPPSTLPFSLPIKSRTRTDNRLELSEDRAAMASIAVGEQDPTMAPSPPTPALTKHRHALLELLTSERAYASNLALIRDVYMRLASGSTYPAETDPDPEHAEAALVAALESKLKSHITTLSHLARDALACHTSIERLKL